MATESVDEILLITGPHRMKRMKAALLARKGR